MKNKLWSKNFVIVLGVTFLMYICYNMYIATLPLYATNIGASKSQIGLIVSLFAIAALLSRPIAGNILDNKGRRTPTKLALLSIAVISTAFFFPSAIIPIITLRFIHGFCWGFTSTSIASLTADVTPKERRAEGWGYFMFISSIAMAIGPILGSIIMENYGFKTVVICTSILLFISVFFSFLVKYPHYEIKKKEDQTPLKLSNLFEKKALLPSLLGIFLMATFGFTISFIIIYGKSLNIDKISYFFVGFSLMILVSKLSEKKILKHFGHHAIIISGAISAIIAFIVLSYATEIKAVVLSSLFYGFGYGMISPTLQAWAVNASPKDRVGAANGTYLAALDIGIAIGATLFGQISVHIGLARTFRANSISIVLLLIIYIIYTLKESKSQYTKESQKQNIYPKAIEE